MTRLHEAIEAELARIQSTSGQLPFQISVCAEGGDGLSPGRYVFGSSSIPVKYEERTSEPYLVYFRTLDRGTSAAITTVREFDGQVPDGRPAAAAACECGAEKTGTEWLGHSDWCPVYTTSPSSP